MIRLIAITLLCLMTRQILAESVIISTTERTARGTVEGQGTAVCVYSTDRGSILLTCRHIVESAPQSVWVRSGGQWHLCRVIAQHPEEDVAILETDVKLKATPLAEDIADGSEVVVDGAGPCLHRTNEDWYFRGIATANQVHNSDGLAVIQGDSGGPVYVRCADGAYAVGGIAYGCTGVPGTRRSIHDGETPYTLFTPTRRFVRWMQTQCCPGGNCPIQIRPQVIQPVGPLGFPRGPARVIGVAEPVPQQYIPVAPQSQPQSVVRGPAGPPGPQGPPGRDGRSVQQAEVEATVNAWLEANIDRMRGPEGPAGRDGSTADVAGLASRLTELEQRKFRIIISSDGKTVDDETYAPGEPVVLDLKRLRSVSDGR